MFGKNTSLSQWYGRIPLHVSGVYLDKNTEEYDVLVKFLINLENMWVDHKTGEPKVNNLTQFMTPLSAWRIQHDNMTTYCATSTNKQTNKKSGAKRKRSGTDFYSAPL